MIYQEIAGRASAAYHRLKQLGIDVHPWESLRKELPEKCSLAIVGNAGYLESLAQGKLIDQCDIVLRMNNFAIESYETQVGSKTDIFLTSFYTDIDYSNPSAREARWIVSSSPNNFFRSDRPQIPHRHATYITRGMKLLRRKKVFAPSYNLYSEQIELIGKYPTTGYMGLLLLSRVLLPMTSTVFITGFSFFSGKSHYFSRTRQCAANHSPDKEARLIFQFLKDGMASGRITVDSLMRKEMQAARDRPSGALSNQTSPPPSNGG